MQQCGQQFTWPRWHPCSLSWCWPLTATPTSTTMAPRWKHSAPDSHFISRIRNRNGRGATLFYWPISRIANHGGRLCGGVPTAGYARYALLLRPRAHPRLVGQPAYGPVFWQEGGLGELRTYGPSRGLAIPLIGRPSSGGVAAAKRAATPQTARPAAPGA